MKKIKNRFGRMGKKSMIISMLALSVLVAGVSYAAFADRVDVLGVTVSVGSADIKLLTDLSGGTELANLADSMGGPSFTNIGPYWQQDYPMKLYNNATSGVTLSSHSDYETVNDPSDLRQDIFVELLGWDDLNEDGLLDEVTEVVTSYGRKTIIKWKTEGFDLGTLDTGGVRGFVLRFSTDSMSDTKQGAVGVFDYMFDAVGIE